jgi:predicted GNAT family N-acyltransferase
MDVNVKIVESYDEKEFVISIRRIVFIQELNIPEHMEIDDNEDLATYVLAKVEGKNVGTARWRETNSGIKLERFAVLNQYRSYGVGTAMTKFILKQLDQSKLIYLNAQESAISFYEKLGFDSTGSMFDEVGIAHQKMIFPNS